MYIYNVTINIEEAVHQPWLKWMQEEHIPDVLSTGKFSKALMSRVMIEEETGGITYSVQYTTDSKEDLNAYYKDFAVTMRNKALQQFPGKFVAFRTELEIVQEFHKK